MTRMRRPLRIEELESRTTPVVGAFGLAPEVTPGNGFDGVVQVHAGDSFGSGTVIYTGRHVLTAAHVLDDNGDRVPDGPVFVRFELPAGLLDMTVPLDHVFIWPGWTGVGGEAEPGTNANDIALITLPALAPSGPGGAERFDLYRGTAELGNEFLAVGYGRTGDGFNGNVEGTSGTRRYGYNRFDTTGPVAPNENLILPGFGLVADFDDGTAAHDTLGQTLGIQAGGLGPDEAAISFGDSGGPAFLFDGVNYLIAGVSADLLSGGSTDIDLDRGLEPMTNSSFGDLVGFTRVSVYAPQIDALATEPYDLTLDLNYQPVGGDVSPDAVRVSASRGVVNFIVNGQVVYSEPRERLKTVTVTASPAGGTLAIDANVPGDLLIRGVGFVPPADARPSVSAQPVAYLPAVAPVGAANARQLFAVGADEGWEPRVRVYDQNGALRFDFLALGSTFTGGVRTAVGDVNGDGFPDVIVGSGPGGPPLVRVVNGRGTGILDQFLAFEESFTGGVYLTSADFNGDGKAEIVVSADQGGGPRVRIIDGATLVVAADFLGIEDSDFRGGARIAAGDVDSDGTPDLLVAAGFGGGPRLALFDGSRLFDPLAAVVGTQPPKLVGDFFVFEPELRNGVFVASGDVNGDGYAEVIAGGGPGGGPRVFALDGELLLAGAFVPAANFFAFDADARGGVRVTTKDLDADTLADVIAGTGPGQGSRITAFVGGQTPVDGRPGVRYDFDPFVDLNIDGVFVG